MAKKRILQAVNDALAEEMVRDPRVILIGQDIGLSVFGDTRQLLERFGASRVRDMPISETLMTGMAAGAGYRVIAHLMFGNFNIHRVRCDRKSGREAALYDGRADTHARHLPCGLQRRALVGRAALRYSPSAAHEFGRINHAYPVGTG